MGEQVAVAVDGQAVVVVLGAGAGGFAVEAALASARDDPARVRSPPRETLTEVMNAAGLARRVGTNLNQAVARLNASIL